MLQTTFNAWAGLRGPGRGGPDERVFDAGEWTDMREGSGAREGARERGDWESLACAKVETLR